MTSVFKVLAGISRPKRSPIKFDTTEDVTVTRLSADDRGEERLEPLVKMLMMGYNETFLNVYRVVFGGVLVPFLLGVIMFGVNLFVESWTISLTLSPLTVIPAILVYLNHYKLKSKRILYRRLRDFYSEVGARGNHVYLAMYKNRRVIGHLATAPFHRQTALLLHFFVRKEYRNSGVGTALLRAAREDLRRQRYKKIRFGVSVFEAEFLENVRRNKSEVCRHACTKNLGTVIPFFNNKMYEFVMDLE